MKGKFYLIKKENCFEDDFLETIEEAIKDNPEYAGALVKLYSLISNLRFELSKDYYIEYKKYFVELIVSKDNYGYLMLHDVRMSDLPTL